MSELARRAATAARLPDLRPRAVGRAAAGRRARPVRALRHLLARHDMAGAGQPADLLLCADRAAAVRARQSPADPGGDHLRQHAQLHRAERHPGHLAGQHVAAGGPDWPRERGSAVLPDLGPAVARAFGPLEAPGDGQAFLAPGLCDFLEVWSIVDVYLIAIFVTVSKLAQMTDAAPTGGAALFFGMVLCSGTGLAQPGLTPGGGEGPCGGADSGQPEPDAGLGSGGAGPVRPGQRLPDLDPGAYGLVAERHGVRRCGRAMAGRQLGARAARHVRERPDPVLQDRRLAVPGPDDKRTRAGVGAHAPLPGDREDRPAVDAGRLRDLADGSGDESWHAGQRACRDRRRRVCLGRDRHDHCRAKLRPSPDLERSPRPASPE